MLGKKSIERAKKKIATTYRVLKQKTIRCILDQESEDETKFKLNKIFELIEDKKLELLIGILGGLLYGAVIPSTSLILGKLTTAFALKDNDEMHKQVLKWSLILFLIAVIGAFCNFFKALKLGNIGGALVSKARKNLFKKYLELDMGFFDFEENNPNGLLSILSVEVYYLKLLFTTILNAMTITTGTIITAIIIGFYYDYKLTLILLCFFPLRIFFSFFAGKFKIGGKKKYKEMRIEASSYFSECVTNTKTLFSFNYQNSAIKIYKSILDKETNEHIKDSLLLSASISAGEFLSFISNSLAYKCAMKFIRHKSLTFAVMIKVKKTLMSYIQGTDITIKGFSDYSKIKVAYKSIFRIFNIPSEINAFEEFNKDKKSAKNIKGKIEFKNVTFSYPTKPQIKILNNVSFIIPRGARAAFVGCSESGKSTIIQLIERFYDIYKGEILIDDINIKDYNLYELRKKIGLISQEPILFKRGLYENILYGKLEAKRAEVFAAANKAAINKILNDKESHINEVSSSQGEKQRISMARVFLKDPIILLLDNITSSLDQDSENEIKKKVSELQKGRTSVSVTHRLSNIVDYDIIFYLENGEIIEQGTHKQLLEKKGKYFSLFSLSEQ